MFKPLIIIFLFLACLTTGYCQNMTIGGNLLDTTNQEPRHNALIVVIRLSDSVLLDFTRSDANGNFAMELVMDTVEVLISHPVHDDKSIFFFPGPGNMDLNLRDLPLPPESDELGEIMIVAYKEPIYFKGDTLVYNADMFETKPNAVVEDLLKKLPGITVDKDGKVSSQGRTVNKILVDGDEFFGDDPTVATKNLGADGVESVEIYETEDENAEAGSDEKIQVMDLKLKEDAKKGYFGRASGASDFANFYEGELLFNRFAGSRKISVFALGSNTPRSGFDWAEANKFGLTNEVDYGNNGFGFNNSSLQGVPRTFKTGIYYSDKLSKNVKFGLDYTFNDNSLNKIGDQTSQYFLEDTTYYTDQVSNSIENYQSHSANMRFEIKLDSLTELTLRPRFSYNNSATANASETNFRDAFQDTTSTTDIYNSVGVKSYDAGAKIRLVRKSKKPKRRLTFNYAYDVSNSESDGILTTRSVYRDLPALNDSIDQSQEQNQTSSSHNAQLFYAEPLNEVFSLNFDYMFNYSDNAQEKITKNAILGTYTDYDSTLSNSFETNRYLNRGGMKIRFRKSKVTASIGAQYRNIWIENINHNGSIINQNINNFLPNAFLNIKFSNSKRLNMHYNTFSNQPSMAQLQPVPNNTDPNRISIGNLELRPNYTHRVSANFNSWKALSGFYVWANGNYSVVHDAFSTSVTYDSLGRAISQAVNVDGNQNGSMFFGMGIPVKQVVKINPRISANYFKNSNYVNSALNVTTTTSVNGNLEIEYNAKSDSLTFFVEGSYGYNNPKSTLSFSSNQPYFTQAVSGGFEVELPFKMSLEAEATYTMNTQRAEGYNINFLIIDAALSKRFLETENLVLSLQGNDILNQNVIAARSVQGNIIVDNRATIISRYFLLKLTLKFNSTKTHEDDPGHRW